MVALSFRRTDCFHCCMNILKRPFLSFLISSLAREMPNPQTRTPATMAKAQLMMSFRTIRKRNVSANGGSAVDRLSQGKETRPCSVAASCTYKGRVIAQTGRQWVRGTRRSLAEAVES